MDAQMEFLPEQQTWGPGCQGLCRELGDKVKRRPGPSCYRQTEVGQARALKVPPVGTCDGSRVPDSGNLFQE